MPKYNNPRKTWRYADEFKTRTAEMSHQKGIQIQQVGQGLGIHQLWHSVWHETMRPLHRQQIHGVFFHSLNAKLIHGEEFRNKMEPRLTPSAYINQFYNRNGPDSVLDYLSPMELERMAARNEACPFYRAKIRGRLEAPRR